MPTATSKRAKKIHSFKISFERRANFRKSSNSVKTLLPRKTFRKAKLTRSYALQRKYEDQHVVHKVKDSWLKITENFNSYGRKSKLTISVNNKKYM